MATERPLVHATNTALYQQDLAAWGIATGALIRQERWDAIDLLAAAEELESLRAGESMRLWEALRELFVWFLAWNYAPAQRMQNPYWYARTVNYRVQIEVVLSVSPSLWPKLAQHGAAAYAHGCEVAMDETGLPRAAFPVVCPWPVEQVIRHSFWPMGDHELDTTPCGMEPLPDDEDWVF